MFSGAVPIPRRRALNVRTLAVMEGTCMGYFISFVLGIFVATVGVGGVANVLDSAVQKTQVYMRENAK